ncbi:hypothetical protein RhoFasGS6_02422 [Rhodococcus fascians]|nr:hypothetical protein [Rhodococcus fascians]
MVAFGSTVASAARPDCGHLAADDSTSRTLGYCTFDRAMSQAIVGTEYRCVGAYSRAAAAVRRSTVAPRVSPCNAP